MSNNPIEFYPWQRELAQQWLGQRERFAHAWLIHGLAGIGKTQFAQAAAASLLCIQPVHGLACGQCDSCLWCKHGNHPDLRLLRPEAMEASARGESAHDSKKTLSKEIRVEQLRQLHTWFNTATHRGGYRVVVLYPAESLNAISANALLKVLEEPPAHTLFMLIADAPDRLLPTILSRCRRLALPVPSTEQSLRWLQPQVADHSLSWLAAAGGGPTAALRLSMRQDEPYPSWLQDLVEGLAKNPNYDFGSVADQLEKEASLQWVDALQRNFFDVSLIQFTHQARYFPELQPYNTILAGRAVPARLSSLLKWLNEQRRWANHPLNAKLLVHHCLDRVKQAVQ